MRKLAIAFILLVLVIGCGGKSTSVPPPTITGHWVGSATSAFGGTSGISGDIVENGTAFTGTLILTGSCLSTVSISGTLINQQFSLTGPNTDGSTLTFTAAVNASDTNISGQYNLTSGSVCPSDHGTVSLNKQ